MLWASAGLLDSLSTSGALIKRKHLMLFLLSLSFTIQFVSGYDIQGPLFWSGPHNLDLQFPNSSLYCCGGGGSVPCCRFPPIPENFTSAVLIAKTDNCPFMYPEEIAKVAAEHGYDAVAMSDSFHLEYGR
jgi:hypothetical protein